MSYKKTNRCLNKIRKTTNEQNRKFSKREVIKKNQTQTLELKTAMHELKNTIESVNVKLDQVEEESTNLNIGHLILPNYRNEKIIKSKERL